MFMCAEYLWGWVKRIVRKETDGKIATLREVVPKTLRSCPLATIRRWSARMWRMVDAYSHRGMNADLAAFIAKKYKSHRDIPLFVGKTLDNLKKEFVDSQNTKKERLHASKK